MAGDPDEQRSDIFVISVYSLTWLLDNGSLGIGGENYAKNTNIANPKHVAALAEEFAVDGVRKETTPFIIAPADPEWASPTKFLQAVLTATQHLIGDAAKHRETFEARIQAALDNGSVGWEEAARVSTWERDWACANQAFRAAMPCVFTLQGQHRAAVFVGGLAPMMGWDYRKAGDMAGVDLFGPGQRGTLAELQAKLLDPDKAKVAVTMHNFPSHRHAQEIGLRQHKADSEAKFPNPASWATLLVPLVLQLYSPTKKLCRDRLTDFLGPGWRKVMKYKGFDRKKPTSESKEAHERAIALQKRFNDNIKNELSKIGVNAKRQPILTLVLGSAFQPDSTIIRVLHEFFNEQQTLSGVAPHASKKKTPGSSGGMERNGNLNSEALSLLYSFEETTQKLPVFSKMLRDHGGVTNPLKGPLVRLVVVEVAIGIAKAVANGDITKDLCPFKVGSKGKGTSRTSLAPPLPDCNNDLESLASAVEQFVDEDAREVLSMDGKIDEVVDSVVCWFGALEEVLDPKKMMVGRFKRGFKTAARNRRGKQQHTNPTPGLAGPPSVSTCAEEIPFDRRVFREYLTFGGTAQLPLKVAVAIFACLVVDRIVHAARGGTGVSQRALTLIAACPPSGKVLTDILVTTPGSFKKPDKPHETFFDEGQMADLSKSRESADLNNGGVEKSARFSVTVQKGSGEPTAVSFNQKQMRALGLLDEEGYLVHEPVDVTLVMEETLMSNAAGERDSGGIGQAVAATVGGNTALPVGAGQKRRGGPPSSTPKEPSSGSSHRTNKRTRVHTDIPVTAANSGAGRARPGLLRGARPGPGVAEDRRSSKADAKVGCTAGPTRGSMQRQEEEQLLRVSRLMLP
eukprot:g16029.t1